MKTATKEEEEEEEEEEQEEESFDFIMTTIALNPNQPILE